MRSRLKAVRTIFVKRIILAKRQSAGLAATMASEEIDIGRVTEYFAHIGVAGVDLTGTLRVGDRIHVRGHTTDLEQAVESMQIEHEQVAEAGAGDKIGIKVRDRCRDGDRVYKIAD